MVRVFIPRGAACWLLSITTYGCRIHNESTRKVVTFEFKSAKWSLNCHKNQSHRHTQAHTRAGPRIVSERWIKADAARVLVMDESTHPSVDLSPLFLERSELCHKMHYLTLLCHPSCLSIWLFFCAGLSPCSSFSVCVFVYLQGTARWILRSSWRYWGPSCCHLTTEKDF